MAQKCHQKRGLEVWYSIQNNLMFWSFNFKQGELIAPRHYTQSQARARGFPTKGTIAPKDKPARDPNQGTPTITTRKPRFTKTYSAAENGTETVIRSKFNSPSREDLPQFSITEIHLRRYFPQQPVSNHSQRKILVLQR
jgi:hypothetical protein